MKEFTPEYLEQLREIIHEHADEAAREALDDLHPADIADLYRDLDLEEAEYLFRLLDEEAQADVLMELDEDERARLLSKMDAEDIAKQIEHLDTDDAVDIIQELDAEERDKILSHIDDVEQAGDIIDLLQYDDSHCMASICYYSTPCCYLFCFSCSTNRKGYTRIPRRSSIGLSIGCFTVIQ